MNIESMLRPTPAQLRDPYYALDLSGTLGNELKRELADLKDACAEAEAKIAEAKALRDPVIAKLRGAITKARAALAEMADTNTLPVQGLETDTYKLVVAMRSRPVLESFDAVPDELLLPTNQWIDWKRVDEAVKKGAVPGFSLAETKEIRIVANKKVAL